jgi:hypothetical protein
VPFSLPANRPHCLQFAWTKLGATDEGSSVSDVRRLPRVCNSRQWNFKGTAVLEQCHRFPFGSGRSELLAIAWDLASLRIRDWQIWGENLTASLVLAITRARRTLVLLFLLLYSAMLAPFLGDGGAAAFARHAIMHSVFTGA